MKKLIYASISLFLLNIAMQYFNYLVGNFNDIIKVVLLIINMIGLFILLYIVVSVSNNILEDNIKKQLNLLKFIRNHTENYK